MTRLSIAVSAVLLLATCTPAPSLIDQIKILGELRVVTREGPLSFHRGSDGIAQGPEYELARRFADELGVRLNIMRVESYDEIYSALNAGQAHLAAAALKVPAQPIAGVSFGPTYQIVREHLIYRRGATRPGSLAEIGEGDLEIASASSHARALRAERDSIPELSWVENAGADSQTLLREEASGAIDYTIADSTEFALAHAKYPDLRIAFDFPGTRALAWAAADQDSDFLLEINRYFRHLVAGGQLAAIVDRYYGRAHDLEYAGEPGFIQLLHSRLPLYKKWFEEAAAQSSQDWRLLAAIGYQESKWNPRAYSPSGAIGLMQLTSQSAAALKVRNIDDPHQNILGGARYLQLVYEKIPAHVPEPDRTWFALAAYNIGYGHLEDARKLAQKSGHDPDSWQQVREFLPRLAEEYWYTQTENGFARGMESVHYVENVRNYRDLLEWVPGGSGNGGAVALN